MKVVQNLHNQDLACYI